MVFFFKSPLQKTRFQLIKCIKGGEDRIVEAIHEQREGKARR